jgi:hypothetical protein
MKVFLGEEADVTYDGKRHSPELLSLSLNLSRLTSAKENERENELK